MQTSTAMQEIIERAYRIFKRYPVPQQFDVCMPCCVSVEEERALRQTPLRELSLKALTVYNGSAKSQEQNSGEIRYLIPRHLEFIAEGNYPATINELCLQRIGRAHPENWLQAERDVLADFARQFITDLLSMQELAPLDEILIMFHFAGLELAPLLNAAIETQGYWAAASLAYLLYRERQNGKLLNCFSDGEMINRQIDDWIQSSCHQLSIRAAEAIEQPATGLTRNYGMESYWIEESLCAMYSYQVS